MKALILKFFILITTSLVSVNAFARISRIDKTGTIVRIENYNNTQQCFFVVDGEKEEMLLNPRPPLNCQDFLNQKVKVIIKPDKIAIPGQYGTLDVLWLDEMSLLSASLNIKKSE